MSDGLSTLGRTARSTLYPLVQLGVELGPLCTLCDRDKYFTDPNLHAAVIDDLRRRAGMHTTLLDEEAGRWVGYYGDDYTKMRAAAFLDAFPGAVAHIALGIERRNAGKHGTYEKLLPPGR